MNDPGSTDIKGAAHYAYDEARFDDRPTLAECEADEQRTNQPDPYKGMCGGCSGPVSAYVRDPGGEGGSCLWTGGPWHPSCREADKAAAFRALDDDPLYDILSAVRVDEESARNTFGDRAVDRAIIRVLAEDGLS